MDPRVQINRKYIELVTDFEVFNSYPWENLSFKDTIDSLHNAFYHKRRAVKNTSQSYGLKGFPLAFQVYFIFNTYSVYLKIIFNNLYFICCRSGGLKQFLN